MNGTNLFKIALRALANNKLRAFLTMLGIIIGVARARRAILNRFVPFIMILFYG